MLTSDLAPEPDRKFEKKLQFYAKVRDTVASLSAEGGIGKVENQTGAYVLCQFYSNQTLQIAGKQSASLYLRCGILSDAAVSRRFRNYRKPKKAEPDP